MRGTRCEGSRAEGPWPPLSDPWPGSAASPVPPRRKTMLNDLLRFDVKDCSWCRWAAVPGRWQGRDTPRLPSLPRAGCKSLWLYPTTLEVSPPPSAVTAAPCQPAVCWAIGVIDPARGEARQYSKGEEQGHLCSCSLWEGRGTGRAAPLGSGKVPRGAHTFLGSFALHWAVCLISPVSHFPALPNRF